MKHQDLERFEGRYPLRLDFLGGTLDLDHLCLSLEKSVTFSVAISLSAYVKITPLPEEEGEKREKKILVKSEDYKEEKEFLFQELLEKSPTTWEQWGLIAYCLRYVVQKKYVTESLLITLSSDSPVGAGLGGSSTLAIGLFSQLLKYSQKESQYTFIEKLSLVKDFEMIVLNKGPTGFQDYVLALQSGMVAMKRLPGGWNFNQYYSKSLSNFITSRFDLFYSGISRNSALNNWQIYKNFYENLSSRKVLEELAKNASEGVEAIKQSQFEEFFQTVFFEAKIKNKAFPEILGPLLSFEQECHRKGIFVKMCGAGGGGCFLVGYPEHVSLEEKNVLRQQAKEKGYRLLSYSCLSP